MVLCFPQGSCKIIKPIFFCSNFTDKKMKKLNILPVIKIK